MTTSTLVLLSLIFAAVEVAEGAPPPRYGWHFAGLPLLNFNSDEGFGYGVRMAAYDHGPDQKPYRLALIGQFFQTTRNVAYHRLQLDAPRVFGSRWRVGLQAQWNAERFSNYFGLGNQSFRDADLTECQDREALEIDPNTCPGNPRFIGARYYQYSERVPTAIVNLRRDLDQHWQLFVGYRFRHYAIDVAYPSDDLGQDAPSKLVEDLNSGVEIVGLELGEDGEVRSQREADVRLGVIYDTRDNEPAPRQGMWHSLTVRAAGPLVGGNHTYGGVTLHLRFYEELVSRLVLAGRALADFSFGDVPFYQLSVTPSLTDLDGLGGGSTLRGVLKNRYIGKIKATGAVELRYRFSDFRWLDQDIALTVVGGFDAGRVWERYANDGPLFDVATGVAAGFYLAWNDNFVIRSDYARSLDEATGLYITFNHYF